MSTLDHWSVCNREVKLVMTLWSWDLVSVVSVLERVCTIEGCLLKKMGSCVVYAPLDRYVSRHLDRYIGRYVGRHIDRCSTDMSVAMSTDISVEGCRSSIGRYVDRYVDRYVGRYVDRCSTDTSVDIAADTRPIRWPLIIGGISVECRWCIGRLSVVYRSTVL